MSTDYRALCAELANHLQGRKDLECGWPGEDPEQDLLDRARTALAQPEPEGVGDVQIMELMPQQLQKDLATVSRLAAHGAGPDVGPGLFRVSLNTGIIEHCRAVLTRYARPTIEPVPVAERPWEREKGWRDLDGECWWCPPDGPPYWQMANPAMVYGGWLLPPRALPLPTPTS
jgi:hypothetical protein